MKTKPEYTFDVEHKYTFDEVLSLLESGISNQSENEISLLVLDLFNLDIEICLLCLRACVYKYLSIGDRTATLYALRCIDDVEMFWKKGVDIWKQPLENVVFVIVRSSHCYLDNVYGAFKRE